MNVFKFNSNEARFPKTKQITLTSNEHNKISKNNLGGRRICLVGVLLLLPIIVKAQTEVIFDFNSGNDIGWGH